MKPAPFAVAFAFALAGCGQGGSEPDAAPSSAAETAAAVAQASTAAAAETPLEFAQCKTCHAVEKGRSGIGPSLAGIVGRKAGAEPGYAFSAAMKSSGLTWDEASLDTFLDAPMQAVPGTKMVYAGMKDPDKRKAVIAYLKTL